jgi:hypothetical protein
MFAGWRPAAPAVVRPRRLAVVDRELDCGEDQREQDRDGRCRDGVNVHLRVSPLGEPSWSELSRWLPDVFPVLPAVTLQPPAIASARMARVAILSD